MKKAGKIILFLSIVIVILAALLVKSYYSPPLEQKYDLLSPRLESGTLKPGSMLIFNFRSLEQDLESYISENKINASLYILNIRDGASFGIGARNRFDAYSLNKLPVAMTILKKVENGELTLNTQLSILNEDRDSNAGTLYAEPVDSMAVGELLGHMLKESDNTAFRVLSRQVTLEDGLNLTSYLDYYQNDLSESRSQTTLQVTPKNTGNLFLSLYLSTYLQPEHSQLILSHLTNTSFDIKKYASLPENVTVAQKYGSFYYETEQYFHSCGIMYITDTRMFYCIMTKGLEREEAHQVVGEIVNKVYRYIIDNRKN